MWKNSPHWCGCLGWILMGWLAGSGLADEKPVNPTTIRASASRAVSYLSVEVAKWKDDHHCYSCHNHGDAARALFAAKRVGLNPSAAALNVCSEWLNRPNDWDKNGPDGPFSDRTLARIQFAAGLEAGIRNKCIAEERSIQMASEQLLADQLESGAWDFEGADEIGAPATYGRPLATVLALRVLKKAGGSRFRKGIAAAERWLREFHPKSVLDASAVMIGLENASDEGAVRQRRHCRDLVLRGQLSDGGWGPYVNSAPEAFDTALAILALSTQTDEKAKQSVNRGVGYLLELQFDDGSWPETTRPTPRESYAQRISTTGWCTLALISQLEPLP